MTVTDIDAVDDRTWFDRNPQRRYRLRLGSDWVIIRRIRGVMLRTSIAELPREVPDADSALRAVWAAAAWPDLNPSERAALIKQITREEGAT